jgi:hypothetical protein
MVLLVRLVLQDQLELLEQLEPLVLLDQLAQQVLMHLRLQQL